MTFEQLGSIGEIVGAISAVAALAYLTLQIRQNTESLRISSYHQATSDLSRQLEAIYQNPEFAEIFRRGSLDPSSLSEQERARFFAYLSAFYYAYENLFTLFDNGRVNPESFENCVVNTLPIFRRPGVEQFGARRVGAVSRGFQDFLHTYEPPAD